MGTRGRPRKTKDKTTDSLLAAVRFVALCQQDIGPVQMTNCRVHQGWIAASNGILTAAAPLADELAGCPHTTRLLAALERCGEGVSITQLDAGRLSVKSGALRAVIPCVEPDQVSIIWGDTNVAPLTEDFLNGCKAINHIASDSGTVVDVCSLLVTGATIAATNRQVVAEYWHGNNMPPYFVLPKAAVVALIRSGKIPTGFGYSGASATFHFADGSWLKTQLFEDKWPNIAIVFDKENNGGDPVPTEVFAALRQIGSFSDCGQVRFDDDVLKSVNASNDGAEYDVLGLPPGPRFAIKNLELIEPICKTMKVQRDAGLAFFYSEKLRGAISCFLT